MKIVTTLIVIFIAQFFVAHRHALASGYDVDLHPTTPYEYWHDYCGFPDVIPNIYEIPDGSLATMLDAEAMLVRAQCSGSTCASGSQIVPRTDDPNYWRFTQVDTNVYFPGTTTLLGGQVPFYAETRFAPNGRSGFLIAPNILATAAHSTDFNPADFVVVFNLRSKLDPVTQTCIAPDPEHIPASDIYFPRAIDPLIANTLTTYGFLTFSDYAAFYLDRPAVDHPYLRVRSTGRAAPVDVLAMAGHPLRLRTKLQYGMTYAGDKANFSLPQILYPLFDNFYIIDGESGSPVYNLDRNYVESVVGSPLGQGCLFVDGDATEVYFYDLCDDVSDPTQLPPPPPFHEVNEGPISTLASLVPTPYLRVDPLNDVTYVLPINGIATPSQTIYAATASSSEAANTQISVSVAPVSVPGEPNFVTIPASYATSLIPGASTDVVANAFVPSGTPCGVYDRYVVIADETHGFRDRMLHRFEVGMTDFDVAPTETQEMYGIAVPSVPDRLEYTLSNTRPTPVSVAVTIDESWAFVIPSPSGNTSFTLAAAGQAGSTKTIGVKLRSAAYSLAAGDHPFTVTFAAQGNCALSNPQQRSGVFHNASLSLLDEVDAYVPVPTPPSAPLTASFDIDESFCIGDMTFKLDNGSVLPLLGLTLADWTPHLALTLDHEGASGTTSIDLWANNALPAGWSVPTYEDTDLDVNVETLLLDNNGNSPPTGAHLSEVFNGANAQGQWTMKVVDNGSNPGRNEALLTRWRLEFWPGACSP
jgi:hypothetical protein